MNIAFDLDDTLIPTTQCFSVGSRALGFPAGLLFKERLRNGAPELLKELALNNEIWIYTSSLRHPIRLKIWFSLRGIKVNKVINYRAHLQAVEGTPFQSFTKAPKLFGIDLLVDDHPGVKIECQRQNARCLIVDPTATQWSEKVREAI